MTLVELAVVLVIVGLLAGGVITGRDMIHNSELRKIPLAIDDVKKKTMVFYNKYGALPGDYNRAEDLWKPDPDGCPSHNNRVPKTQTCNGNYDGIVGMQAHRGEYFRFWQHLRNANLTEGEFTGVAGSINQNDHVVGENVPVIYDYVGIGVYWHEPPTGANAWQHEGDYGQLLVVGESNSWGWENSGSFLTPSDALSIDNKIDDGMPLTGNVYGMSYSNCTTADAGEWTETDANYDVEETSETCAFFIRNAFPKK